MVHPLKNSGLARTYVITGKDGLMVVDVGSIGSAEDVVEYVTGTPGMELGDILYVVSTHFHIDHIGGIGHLLDKCPPTTKALFNYMVEDYLNGKRKLSLIKNWFVGCVPASVASTRYVRKFSHFKFEGLAGIPLPGLRNIVKLPYGRDRIGYFKCEGDTGYNLGFDEWEVLATPGHTEDSVSFYNGASGELICGDMILNMKEGGRGALNRFYWSRKLIIDSYNRLCNTIKPQTIYPGHGEIIKGDENALLDVETF
ncbi:MAG: MBL fold metallo-hydrolase [Proteobacteria bacterium]|nr:MBL fold metallo-hydrolase [Pseudomonadota bacterium]